MISSLMFLFKRVILLKIIGDHHGRDRMVVGFITSWAIGAYHH